MVRLGTSAEATWYLKKQEKSVSTLYSNDLFLLDGVAGSSSSSSIENVFWNEEISDLDNIHGGWSQNNQIINTLGLSTAEMKQSSTYINSGWDFNTIWTQDLDRNFGYPYLQFAEDYVPQTNRPKNLSGELDNHQKIGF